MKKISKQQRALAAESKPERVVGLDLGDRYSHYCMLTGSGELMEEGQIRSAVAALDKQFGNEPRMRIALETGTHSPWVSRLLESQGHQVIVANARKIPVITASESKNDRNDAEQLARMAAFDPKLLHPVEHRSLERQQDLNLVHTRSVLVRARTMLINSVRGLVKSGGGRLPVCSSAAFPGKAREAIQDVDPGCAENRLRTVAGTDCADEPGHWGDGPADGPADRWAGEEVSGDLGSAHGAWRGPGGGGLLCVDAGPCRGDGD